MHPGGDVIEIEGTRTSEVVDALAEAFSDYPVMRFVIGGDRPDYELGVLRLVGLFVGARVLRREPLLGIPGPSGLEAAAIVSQPGRSPTPDAFRALAREVWDELGEAAKARYDAFSSAAAPFQVPEPHLHLNMIGVRRRAQGRGLGKALIEHVHAMSRHDEESAGVSLTTEDPRNVPMYEHLGYHVVGHASVGPELETWGFYRPD